MAGLDFLSAAHFESCLDLSATLMDAVSPNSPGGQTVTPAEWEQARTEAQAVTHEAEELMVVDKLVQQVRHRGVHKGVNKPLGLELRRYLGQ